MAKVTFDIEVQLIALTSIIAAPGQPNFRVDFQAFSETEIVFGGRAYEFIDSSVVELHSRQTQFSTIPQRIVIRNSPIASQRGDNRLPGLTTKFTQTFSIDTPLDLVKNFDGLRRSTIEIKYIYRDANDNYRLDRKGRSQIVETKIKGSEILFKLSNVFTPNRPIGLIRSR